MRSRMKVLALSATPVKGLRLSAHSELRVEGGGVRGDRRLYLIDELGQMVNGKRLGALNEIEARLENELSLSLRFPDGKLVSDEIVLGEAVSTSFFSSSRLARIVEGPFSRELSRHTGMPLRLVEPEDGLPAVDRGEKGAVTMISRGSLAAVARAAGTTGIDARRFRMSIEIDAEEPFAEDGWIDREVSVGEVRIALRGHVGRCIVTSRHPDSGEVDLPVLDLLRDLRRDASSTEPLSLGVHGAVVQPGLVRVGDEVKLGPAISAGGTESLGSHPARIEARLHEQLGGGLDEAV